MRGIASSWPARSLGLAVIVLAAACSKPPPDPPAKAIPAKVVAGTSLSADPNPILSDGSGLGETTITWSTNASRTELRIGSPNGKLFVDGGSKGLARTGKWVNNGMTFYLQSKDSPDSTSADATLGVLSIAVQ
jgi:hypothetical protein